MSRRSGFVRVRPRLTDPSVEAVPVVVVALGLGWPGVMSAVTWPPQPDAIGSRPAERAAGESEHCQ